MSSTSASVQPAFITPQQLKTMIADGKELALLDVREQGAFARRHLLLASVAPLGRLEWVIDRLVPRRGTRIVLVDDAGEYTGQAAEVLAGYGYADIAILKGGTTAWEAAGHEVFSGTNSLTKAFGEIIEHQLHTPNLSATELKGLLDAQADLIVLDSRPIDEFKVMNIPNGIDCPGAELVHRFYQAVPSPETLVVVNCAGRTRSILGAQSLINAGVPNPVVALTGGSMAWLLDGFVLEHGQIRSAPLPSPDALERSRALAQAAARKAGVQTIDAATLARFESERNERSLYLFDVRSPEEYAAGHLPGWRSAPGGQLVQATDEYAGVRRSRIVLFDTDGVRARMTASWLVQLGGFEVYVLETFEPESLEVGPEPVRVLRPAGSAVCLVDVAGLQGLLASQAVQIFDVDNSLAYRDRHIAGAWFATPTSLPEKLAAIAQDKTVVLTSHDGALAHAVALGLRARTGREVLALVGGTAAWFAAGQPGSAGSERNLTGDDDTWYSPYAYEGEEKAKQMIAYLDWELALVKQLERDGDAEIRVIDFNADAARQAA